MCQHLPLLTGLLIWLAIISSRSEINGRVRDIDLQDQIITIATPEQMIDCKLAERVKLYDVRQNQYIPITTLKAGASVAALRARGTNLVTEIVLLNH